jgi:hypothetical protein
MMVRSTGTSSSSQTGRRMEYDSEHKTPIVMDSAGTCFGNTQATAERCIGRYIWDRPCSQDSGVPYHDPRRGRGGCKSGMCEMPLVGNASSGSRQATPAMVHGCSPSDANYPFCSQQPLYQAIFSKESVIPGVPPNWSNTVDLWSL